MGGLPSGLSLPAALFISSLPVSSVPACPRAGAGARAIVERGDAGAARALIDAGQPRAAIEKLQALGDRDNPLVAELLGVAYFHANDPAKAIEHLTPVVARLAPGSLERREAVQVLGLSHYLAGHLAEAIPLSRGSPAARARRCQAGVHARHGLRADAAAGQGARSVRPHVSRARPIPQPRI